MDWQDPALEVGQAFPGRLEANLKAL